jgi:hypothetical protein
MVVSPPVTVSHLMPQVRAMLHAARAALEASPTPENAELLAQLEAFAEDLIDLQDSITALEELEKDRGEGTASWKDLKTELGR